MNFISFLVMLIWIPLVFYLFKGFPTQKAVIISFIAAWLFLPQAEFPLPGLPDYTKISATCCGVLLASFIYDYGRFKHFNFNIIDVPMLIWCICPFFSSISNGLGAYDGLATTLSQTIIWGIPYFLGRIYLNSLAGLHKLANSIFIGGLIYVPFCLFEVRMSPQLHRIVYGAHAHSFAQTMRLGGFRPTVFMKHGLEVGMWMMAASLIGIWLWKVGCIEQIRGISIYWLVSALLITFILVKSTGAYALLLIGIIILFAAWQFRTSLFLLLLICSIYFYLGQNTITSVHTAQTPTSVLARILPEARIKSLQFRIDNEVLLKEKAQQRIILGWGGWNRNRVYDYNFKGEYVDISITDSLWIIAFGINGLVGLVSLFSAFLLPVINFVIFYPSSTWSNRKIAPIAALAVILILYMLDCLLNSMINPIFILACGGISGLGIEQKNLQGKQIR